MKIPKKVKGFIEQNEDVYDNRMALVDDALKLWGKRGNEAIDALVALVWAVAMLNIHKEHAFRHRELIDMAEGLNDEEYANIFGGKPTITKQKFIDSQKVKMRNELAQASEYEAKIRLL